MINNFEKVPILKHRHSAYSFIFDDYVNYSEHKELLPGTFTAYNLLRSIFNIRRERRC